MSWCGPLRSDLGAVIERLLREPAFRSLVCADPAAALRGYELDDVDREVVVERAEAARTAEPPRTRRPARRDLLAGLDAYAAELVAEGRLRPPRRGAVGRAS